jgi:hypothetical protein
MVTAVRFKTSELRNMAMNLFLGEEAQIFGSLNAQPEPAFDGYPHDWSRLSEASGCLIFVCVLSNSNFLEDGKGRKRRCVNISHPQLSADSSTRSRDCPQRLRMSREASLMMQLPLSTATPFSYRETNRMLSQSPMAAYSQTGTATTSPTLADSLYIHTSLTFSPADCVSASH